MIALQSKAPQVLYSNFKSSIYNRSSVHFPTSYLTKVGGEGDLFDQNDQEKASFCRPVIDQYQFL